MGLAYSKSAYYHAYEDGTKKIHTGERMIYGIGTGDPTYWARTHPFIDFLRGSQLSGFVGARDSNGYPDANNGLWTLSFGNSYPIDSTDRYILRWFGTGTAAWNEGTLQSTIVRLINGQDETSYDNSPTDEGTFSGGTSGYNVNDVITLNSGAEVTVDAVNGSNQVTQFTVDSTTQTSDSAYSTADNQSSVAPAGGTNFSLTPDDKNIYRDREYSYSAGTVNGEARTAGNLKVDFLSGTGTSWRAHLFRKDDLADFEAGKVLSPIFKTDLAGDTGSCPLIRTMQWQIAELRNIRDVADIPTINHITWSVEKGQEDVGTTVPPEVEAKAANELGAQLWTCLPHQATDACVSEIAAQHALHYEFANGPIMYEVSNETWNPSAAFKDQNSWFIYGDQASTDSTFTPSTSIAAETAHGLVNGDSVILFSNQITQLNGYANGAQRWVHKIDNDNFAVLASAHTVTAATKANPCQITYTTPAGSHKVLANGDTIRFININGMTELNYDTNGNVEYTVANVGAGTFELSGIDSQAYGTFTTSASSQAMVRFPTGLEEVTLIRWKKGVPSADGRPKEAAKREMEMWDLCETEVGAANIFRMGADQAANNGAAGAKLAVVGYRDALDGFAIAPYYNWRDLVGWETATMQQLSDWVQGPSSTGQVPADELATYVDSHHLTLKGIPIYLYECGDHNGFSGSDPNGKIAEYARDSVCEDDYIYYFQWLASKGVKAACVFGSHATYSSQGTWGNMEYPGQRTYPKYLVAKAFWDAGGVPKP